LLPLPQGQGLLRPVSWAHIPNKPNPKTNQTQPPEKAERRRILSQQNRETSPFSHEEGTTRAPPATEEVVRAPP